MRKIFSLMIPVNLSGNIYHKASTFICLPFLLICFLLSAWSNVNGAEKMLASLPDAFIKIVIAFVLFIDPINWLCFVLALVSIQAFRIVEHLQVKEEIPDQLVKGLKPTLVIASIFFIGLTVALTYATYLLSDDGGHKGAAEYISNHYSPDMPLDSMLMQEKSSLKADISSINAAYAGRINTLKADISKQKADTSKYKNWNNPLNWKRYNKYTDAKVKLDDLNEKLTAVYNEKNSKQEAAKADSERIIAAKTDKHNKQQAKHDELQEEAAVVMDYIVVSWTLIGLIVQLISYILTADKYKTVAYVFISQSLNAYDKQQQMIDKELQHISFKNQKVIGNTYDISSTQSNNISKPEAPAETLIDDTKQLEEPAPVDQIPEQATQAEEAPEKASVFNASDQFIANQIRKNHSSEWLQNWKPALVDEELLTMPIKKLMAKYDCSRSQVDGLRRNKKSLLNFTKDQDHLHSILEKI